MERGITAETAGQSMILYAPVGWLRQRVIFPIRSGNEIVYYVARDVTGLSSRKYLNAPWGKNGLVYTVGRFPTDTVVVVEGVFDAYATDRAGWHSAAILGKRINAGQSRMLATLARRALVLLDADAYSSALEVSFQLSYYMPTRRVELPRGKDPDSYARNDLRALLGKAMKEWADAEEPKEAKLVRS
jgi:DNA primase